MEKSYSHHSSGKKSKIWVIHDDTANENVTSYAEGDCESCLESFTTPGISSISDSELLSILLCCGFSVKRSGEVSTRLINTFDGLHGVDYASIKEISQVEGFCLHKAGVVKAAMELGRRAVMSNPKSRVASISKSCDIAKIFMPQMKSLRKELFAAAILDTKNKLIKTVTISEGGLAAAVANPREVFNPAVREMAHGIILVHNHPSGDPQPSEDDTKLTRRLVQAGKLIGIEVIDHIIIGDNRYHSFIDEGML